MDKRTEDAVIATAADLYRQWEARPWHVKLKGRIREMRERMRYMRRRY